MDEVQGIVKQYAIPNEKKHNRNEARLLRMLSFYKEKADTAPENQALLFNGFINALEYYINIGKTHNKIVKQLHDVAKSEQVA